MQIHHYYLMIGEGKYPPCCIEDSLLVLAPYVRSKWFDGWLLTVNAQTAEVCYQVPWL
jgi:hypothetical protein